MLTEVAECVSAAFSRFMLLYVWFPEVGDFEAERYRREKKKENKKKMVIVSLWFCL